MEKFQVDLRGIVEILSHHLYSSPRVFVRELLQNGIDAITARRQVQSDHSGSITITAHDDGRISFADDGIGLADSEIRELLATIGRSSKRDELDLQREGFLGQFGIGLLSCFLVSETIEVRTRSAREPDAPTLRWLAYGDGTFEISPCDPLASPGTVVILRPRSGEQWLRPDVVHELATHYGALLPVPIAFIEPSGIRRAIAPRTAPWQLPDAELSDYCRHTFGFTPMATIPLEVPVTGVRGIAFVLPDAASPGEISRHRVYLRRMLLGESVAGLMPPWAPFVRVAIDVQHLRPTASRESLYDDEVLAATRRQLGEQLRRWLVRMDKADPDLLAEFIDVHWLGVAGAALTDDEVLGIARAWLPWTTTTGESTMAELLRGGKTVRYAASTKAFEALQAVAAARGIQVVNAGYTHGLELLRRFDERDPEITLQAVGLTDLIEERAGGPDDERLRGVIDLARHTLRNVDCEVAAREFEPSSTPALYVVDPERAARVRQESRRQAAEADPILAGILAATDSQDEDAPETMSYDTLVLNPRNRLVMQLPAVPDATLAELVRVLYFNARQSAGHQLSDGEREQLTDALLALASEASRRSL